MFAKNQRARRISLTGRRSMPAGVERLETRDLLTALEILHAAQPSIRPEVAVVAQSAGAPLGGATAKAHQPAQVKVRDNANESSKHYYFFAFQQIPGTAVGVIKRAQGRFAARFGDDIQINGEKGLHISVVRIGVIPDSRASRYFDAAQSYVTDYVAKHGDPRFHFYDKSGAKLVIKGSFVSYNAYLAHDSSDFAAFATGIVKEIKAKIKRGNPPALGAEKGTTHISIFHFDDSASDEMPEAVRSYNANPKNPKLTFEYTPATLYLMESLPDHQYRAVRSIAL